MGERLGNLQQRAAHQGSPRKPGNPLQLRNIPKRRLQPSGELSTHQQPPTASEYMIQSSLHQQPSTATEMSNSI